MMMMTTMTMTLTMTTILTMIATIFLRRFPCTWVLIIRNVGVPDGAELLAMLDASVVDVDVTVRFQRVPGPGAFTLLERGREQEDLIPVAEILRSGERKTERSEVSREMVENGWVYV